MTDYKVNYKIIGKNYPTTANLILYKPALNPEGKDEIRFNLYVTHSPLSNCQTFTIGGGNQLANIVDKDIKEIILYALISKVAKGQFLIDIYTDYVKDFKENFKDFGEVIVEAQYINSTSTDMTLVLFRIYENVYRDLLNKYFTKGVVTKKSFNL